MATNLFGRDLDLGVPDAHDNRRQEVVADGLPLFGGVDFWWLQFRVMANCKAEPPTRTAGLSNGPAG